MSSKSLKRGLYFVLKTLKLKLFYPGLYILRKTIINKLLFLINESKVKGTWLSKIKLKNHYIFFNFLLIYA